jgi:hypothetical protein
MNNSLKFSYVILVAATIIVGGQTSALAQSPATCKRINKACTTMCNSNFLNPSQGFSGCVAGCTDFYNRCGE